MRTIKQTAQFKRDLKRESRGRHRKALQTDFVAIVAALAKDEPLAEKQRDHALTGEWKDHRDCHVRPDLVLIYRKPATADLELVRLGSHSELGLRAGVAALKQTRRRMNRVDAGSGSAVHTTNKQRRKGRGDECC